MPTFDTHQKDRLLRLAEEQAGTIATEHGRARIGGPVYSAGDLSRGGWSCIVAGLTDADVETTRVRVFVDGTTETVEIGGRA